MINEREQLNLDREMVRKFKHFLVPSDHSSKKSHVAITFGRGGPQAIPRVYHQIAFRLWNEQGDFIVILLEGLEIAESTDD